MKVFEIKRIGPYALYGTDGKLFATGLLSELRSIGKDAAETVRDNDAVDVQVQEFDAEGRLTRIVPCYVKTDDNGDTPYKGEGNRTDETEAE